MLGQLLGPTTMKESLQRMNSSLSRIFFDFLDTKKRYNQSTPDKFLVLTCQEHRPNLAHWHSQLAHLLHWQGLPFQQSLLWPGCACKHKGPVKINTLIWSIKGKTLKVQSKILLPTLHPPENLRQPEHFQNQKLKPWPYLKPNQLFPQKWFEILKKIRSEYLSVVEFPWTWTKCFLQG